MNLQPSRISPGLQVGPQGTYTAPGQQYFLTPADLAVALSYEAMFAPAETHFMDAYYDPTWGGAAPQTLADIAAIQRREDLEAIVGYDPGVIVNGDRGAIVQEKIVMPMTKKQKQVATAAGAGLLVYLFLL